MTENRKRISNPNFLIKKGRSVKESVSLTWTCFRFVITPSINTWHFISTFIVFITLVMLSMRFKTMEVTAVFVFRTFLVFVALGFVISGHDL